jgi:hypothetical protein
MRVQGGFWSIIANGITSKSYTVTGLTLGTTYEFTVEAQNSVGYSTPSSQVVIFHAMVPTAPSAPTLTNDDTSVIIDWVAPANNGAEITRYTILIRESNDVTYTEHTADCDGSDATIISNTHCEVPLAVLTASPYQLLLGEGIFAKVIATNTKGDSAAS